MHKITKRKLIALFISIYLGLLGYHIFLLYFGRASVITTILSYITLCFILLLVLLFLKSKFTYFSKTHNNWKLTVIASLFFLLCLELVLRYGFDSFHSYTESNKHFYYQSFYRKNIYDNYLNKTKYHRKPTWYWVNGSNLSYYITQPEFSYLHTYNSKGLREEEIPEKKDSAEYRIIALGDSFTEGIGADQDSTWPVFLERILNEKYSSKKITTINAGASGSDPFYEFILLRDRLLSYKPDLVILAINSSDFEDILVRGGMERFLPGNLVQFKDAPWWEYFYSFSYVLRAILHKFFHYNSMLIPDEKMMSYFEEIHNNLKAVFADYQRLAVINNFEFKVIFIPYAPEFLNRDIRIYEWEARVKDQTGVEIVDLYNIIVNESGVSQTNVDNYYWRLDGHPNQKGYKIIAQGVANKIVQMNIIK
jgi:lysophospholipase L1-like esterase